VNKAFLDIFICPSCGGSLSYESETLACMCGASYPIICDVPVFINISVASDVIQRTAEHYGQGWVRGAATSDPSKTEPWHYDEMIKVRDFPVAEIGWGIEGGCGNGKDTARLALSNPDSMIIAVDLSEGAYVAQRRLQALGIKNVQIIRADLANLPIRSDIFEWGYSFGVLHHMPDPNAGLKEMSRVLKRNAQIALYLYSDLREKPMLRVGVLATGVLRVLTKKLPLVWLRFLCIFLMPFVFVFLTLPARVLKGVGLARLAQKIPHHHNKSFLSLFGELYDRLGAQIEFRYNQQTLVKLYENSGMKMIGTGQIPIWRGWVSWGRKL
jgi:SAM-dependent methyltransferase/uncharacterized protein YbaR (Trm112 family)